MATAIHTPAPTVPGAHIPFPALAALFEALVEAVRAGAAHDAWPRHRMRHEDALRGPLSDEIRRAGWL